MNDDLISRKMAIDAIIDHIREKFAQRDTPLNYISGLYKAEDIIEILPPAQPEIIRCKDCKHYYFADSRVPSEQSWVCDAWGVDQTAHTGYCFKAERRTDG